MRENSAPRAGPMMKPRPNAAPRTPYDLARFSSVLMSAMYARAVVMLPPDSPSTMRAANSIHRLCATASITKLTTVPMRLRIRTGRRPQRSDHSPSSGAAISWATEKEANNSPTTSGDAPNVWA